MGGNTPYALVAAAERVRRGRKTDLVVLSRQLERAALADPPPAVAATLQDERFLTPATRAVYAELAAAGRRRRGCSHVACSRGWPRV